MRSKDAAASAYRIHSAEYIDTQRRRQMAARKLENAAQALHDAVDLLHGLNVPGVDCQCAASEMRSAALRAIETAMVVR